MALTLKDRVLETAAAPGTGAVTLLGAVTGYQTFSAAIGNGNTCYYTIADQSGANWEVGIGTYSSSGNTLARTTILSSSNAGSTVNFASGTQNVFVTYPSEKAVYLDASGNVQPSLGTATFSSITDSGLTSGRVTYAGTSGLLQDSANLTFNGTTLTANTLNLTNALGVAYGGTGLTTLTSGYIPYGNGTSAFSSSSGLKFDTTTLTITGSSSAGELAIRTGDTSTNVSYLTFGTTSYNRSQIQVGGSALTDGYMAFLTESGGSNNERMRITSTGNVGIGSTSPTNGQLVVSNGSSVNQISLDTASTATYGYFNIGFFNNGAFIGTTAGSNTASNILRFGNNGEQMRLDASGNLGLGVTPSAWGGNNKAIEGVAYGSGQFYLASGASGVVSNAYNNGTNWIYKTTQYATNYWQFQGQHLWYNAPSGTAGNAITFTQAMTLNNSGQLLVGTTTAYGSSKLVVCPTTTPTSGTDGNTQIQIGEATSNTGYHLNLGYGNFSGSYYGYIQAIAGGSNTPLLLQPSGGNVGIGTSSPASLLNVVGGRTYLYGNSEAYALKLTYNSSTAGFYLGSPSANTLSFSNDSGTEFARIDSSGNLGLGVTPSAWSGKAFETPAGGILGYSTSSMNMTQNAYFNGTNWIYKNTAAATYYGQGASGAGQHAWYTAPSGTAGNAITFTQAMTLTNSGTLFVGQTSAVVNENGMGVSSSQTSGGSGVLNVTNTASSSADNSPPVVICKAMTTTSSSARFVQFYANTTATPMGGIVGNGASNVQFASISDAREKTNIAPINGSLNKILALKPSSFDWIKDGSHVNAGFIAQDVQTVFPEFVVENMANEGEEQRYGLTGGMNGGIIAHLVSAIQELKAEFDAYKATHP